MFFFSSHVNLIWVNIKQISRSCLKNSTLPANNYCKWSYILWRRCRTIDFTDYKDIGHLSATNCYIFKVPFIQLLFSLAPICFPWMQDPVTQQGMELCPSAVLAYKSCSKLPISFAKGSYRKYVADWYLRNWKYCHCVSFRRDV